MKTSINKDRRDALYAWAADQKSRTLAEILITYLSIENIKHVIEDYKIEKLP